MKNEIYFIEIIFFYIWFKIKITCILFNNKFIILCVFFRFSQTLFIDLIWIGYFFQTEKPISFNYWVDIFYFEDKNKFRFFITHKNTTKMKTIFTLISITFYLNFCWWKLFSNTGSNARKIQWQKKNFRFEYTLIVLIYLKFVSCVPL